MKTFVSKAWAEKSQGADAALLTAIMRAFISRAGTVAFLAVACLLFPLAASGDEAIAWDTHKDLWTYEWSLSPADEPSPALKHRLIPGFVDQVPGNAASHYLRAILFLKSFPQPTRDEFKREAAWSEMQADQLPLEEVKQWLAIRESVLGEVAKGTRCETCDWGIRFQDLRGSDVITFRLEEFQQARALARLVRLKAQVEIAEKRFDDAIATLRTGYALAHHVGQAPNLIVSLVSTAITAVMNTVAGEFLSAEGSPNLYWGLRLLPDPVVDQQRVIQQDINMLFQMFPFLKEADTVEHTSEEWQRLLLDAMQEMRQMSDSNLWNELTIRVPGTMLVIKSYPIAKKALLRRGMDAARVEQMPVGQVVAIYARDCFQHVADEWIKWSSLPFHEGHRKLEELDDVLRRDGYLSDPNKVSERDPLFFNRTMPSAFTNISQAFIRQRRMTAALVTVEAIRIYAATNGGRLPNSLAEITKVSVPLDPASLKPFLYRVVAGQAELIAPATRPGDKYSGRRFLLKLR